MPPTTLVLPALLLAQFGQPPDPLPSPPFLAHYFLEDPLPVSFLLVITGVIVLFVMSRVGQRPRGTAVAGILALLAGGIWALSILVETEREHAIARTERLIAAAAHVDIPALDTLLAPQARAVYFEARTGLDKPEILSRVKSYLAGPYKVKEAAILLSRASSDRPGAMRVQTRVRVVPDEQQLPAITWWLVDWSKEPSGEWRCVYVELQNIEGFAAGAP